MLRPNKFLFAVIITLIAFAKAFAVDERYAAKPLKGNQIAVDSLTTVTDTIFAANYYRTGHTVINMITFKINEYANLLLPDNFTVNLSLQITLTQAGSTTGTIQTSTRTEPFTIEYKRHAQYVHKDMYKFDGAYIVTVKILSISVTGGPTLAAVRNSLMIENEILINRQYGFGRDSSAVQSIAHENHLSTKGELKLVWPKQRYADEYDVEWTFIDSAALGFYKKDTDPNSFDPSKIFFNNASRVGIKQESYMVPMLFDGRGHLFYRVRSVQVKLNGQRIEANWSSDYSGGLGSFDFAGHDSLKNWQSATSFAEEGKRKTVMQYFDGSLRNRQTVTKDNTTDTTIVAETFYDHQGRPSIQVLPVPTLTSIIKYTPNFNAQLNGVEYQKSIYDGLLADSSYCRVGAPGMSTGSGASNYYSPSNPLAANGFHRYIPDAKTFPFSETRYLSDNTGRITMQGGVGDSMQIGKSHETKYYYGGADQEELHALFGTEAGNAKHYFKNMVRDGNGQFSVSYVDMHGRTVATALAGKPVAKLDTLVSKKDRSITRRLLDSTSNLIKGNVIESSRGLMVTKQGDHRFVYSLMPDSISIKDKNDVAVCYDCMYDLEITITDDCNNATTGGAPIRIVRSNVFVTKPDTLCNTNVLLPALDTTVFLKEGNYLVTKKLTLSQKALEYYRDSIFILRNTHRTFQQFVDEQYAIVRSQLNCAPVTCQSCRDSLGTWSDYRGQYLTGLGVDTSEYAAYEGQAQLAYNKMLEACDELCIGKPLHKSVREQMLADVSPPYGQYANKDNIDGFSIFRKSNEKGLYQSVSYTDANGKQDDLLPHNLPIDQFIAEFKSSWADSLLRLHPEYCKLVKFESLAKSHEWDLKFESVNTFQKAVDSGFLNPADFSGLPDSSIYNYNEVLADPLFYELAPTYQPAMQDSLFNKYKGTIPAKNINAWSLATIMAYCKDSANVCQDNNRPFVKAFGYYLCESEKDMAWQIFRGFYLEEKREIINRIMVATCGPDKKYDSTLYFENLRDPNKKYEHLPDSEPRGKDSLTALIADYCNSYVQQWWQELKPCNYSSADSAIIIPRMIQVCKEGGDINHAFGASTVRPSSTDTLYRSFKDVLYKFDSTKYNTTCNVYLITAPKPYDQQPVYFDKPIYKKPDSCECSNISSLYSEYQVYGDSTLGFSSYIFKKTGTTISNGAADTLRQVCAGSITCNYLLNPINLPAVFQCEVKNECVDCKEIASLYDQYNMEFPDYKPIKNDTDSTQHRKNRLFANYLNSRLGFSKETVDYLDFMERCSIFPLPSQTVDSTLTQLLDIKEDFVNLYYNNGRTYDQYGSDIAPWIVSKVLKPVAPHHRVFANGWMSYPDTTHVVNWDFVKRDSACIGNGYSLEWRMRDTSVKTRSIGLELWYRVESQKWIKHYIVFNRKDYAGNILAFYNWNDANAFYEEDSVSEFSQDYSYWRTLKFEMIDSVFKFFLDGQLKMTRIYQGPAATAIRMDKFYGLGFSSGFGRTSNGDSIRGNVPQIDWIKAYDRNGRLFYNEQFNDVSNFSLFAPYIQCPRQSCDTAFTNYYNSKKGTQLTYSQIEDIYENKNIPLDFCDTSNLNLKLCGKSEPVFPPLIPFQHSSCDDSTMFAVVKATQLYNSYKDSLINSFSDKYTAKCLQARFSENFTLTQPTSEFHYTLYYYDLAGNLVKTVPPAGVDVSKFDWMSAWSDSVWQAKRHTTLLTPAHKLVTQYRYNTLNQVVAQFSPDGGTSKFWYDRLGRLAISQNSKQRANSATEENRHYSYTRYDYLGRITEVGQVSNTDSNGAMSNIISRSESLLNGWMLKLFNRKDQITQTVYDLPYSGFSSDYTWKSILIQRNLRNRVSYVSYSDSSIYSFNNAIFYSYDIHGNVDTLVQDYGPTLNVSQWNVMNKSKNRYKKIAYNYDLVSGKVNMVMYQRGWADEWLHRYSYDAENRITLVETSLDSLVWERDARYEYYKHGPLARIVIGEQLVQGIDYAYTLQGWLKGINSTGSTSTHDMGSDGRAGSTNQFVARDQLGVTLNYFGNDYSAINTGFAQPFPGFSGVLPAVDYRPLFNGNISSSSQLLRKLNDPNKPGGSNLFYSYKYDQLNRLTAMTPYRKFDTLSNSWKGDPGTNMSKPNIYGEEISYDGNGNILTYNRQGGSANNYMDKLTYRYYAGTNKLERVTDQIAAPLYGNNGWDIVRDLDSQAVNNYVYDSIGNLTKNTAESISDIQWTVYGKIKEITRSATTFNPYTKIKYIYDAQGNRIGKTASRNDNKTEYTWYGRDAQGNMLQTYEVTAAPTDSLHKINLEAKEKHIYGSSRLGMYTFGGSVKDGPGNMQWFSGNQYQRSFRIYEVSNHLGNVLLTMTDKKFGVDSANNGTLDYYEADVRNAIDYYPFGMMMSRSHLDNQYRIGFNGKENDKEAQGYGNQQDYGMRIYDNRLGRFLSVDPLTKDYPWYSPYQFAGNNPIKYIDLDGLEPAENPAFPSKNELRSMSTVTSIAVGAGFRNVKKNMLSQGLYKNIEGKLKGSYSIKTGLPNYITDTKGDEENKYNMKVSDHKIFKVDESQAKDFASYEAFVVDVLMTNFVNGTGPENYEFPTNGTISSKFQKSGIFAEALNRYKTAVKEGVTGTVIDDQIPFGKAELANDLMRTGTPYSITGLTGSAKITMMQTDQGVKVTIFNILSLYSGDASKDLFGATPAKSYVRDGDNQTRFGNISVTFNLFLPYSSPLLK